METKGELLIRTLAMPTDTNPNGDVFGGWLMSQMDIAGAILSAKIANGRVVTVKVNTLTFHRPVYVGDILCCYGTLDKVGTTSVTVGLQAWVTRGGGIGDRVLVTEADFKYVAIGPDGRPREIDPEKSVHV